MGRPTNYPAMAGQVSDFIRIHGPATLEQISAGVGIAYSTLYRVITQMEIEKIIENTTPMRLRNRVYGLANGVKAAKMPYYRSFDNRWIPLIVVWESEMRRFEKEPDFKYNKANPSHLFINAILYLFASALADSQGDPIKESSKLYTVGRQYLMQAMNLAENIRSNAEKLFEDPRTQLKADLKKTFLEDPTNQVNPITMYNQYVKYSERML